MKYVVLNLSGGREMVLFFDDLLRHAEAVPSGMSGRVVSGGHFELLEESDARPVQFVASSPRLPGLVLHAFADAASVGKAPRVNDARLILDALLGRAS